MTRRFVITAVGDDRPGIVAAFTGALLELEANLEDTAMTLLEGQFAMVLVIAVPMGEVAEVRDALSAVSRSFGLMVDVREPGSAALVPTGRQFSLTVYGADHSGIVHRVAAVLAGLDVNVVARAPACNAPCTAPMAPASDCISITEGTASQRFFLPFADHSSHSSPIEDEGVIG